MIRIAICDDEKKILIDSGALDSDVDNVLIPALKEEGYTLQDIDYLVNTHSPCSSFSRTVS